MGTGTRGAQTLASGRLWKMNWQQRQRPKLPRAPIPWRQGEQVCQGSLLQQELLLLLTNARVERLPCNSSLPLGPTTNNGRCQHCSSSNARGVLLPSMGTPGARARGTAARSQAEASQQHPTPETSRLRAGVVRAWGARLYPRQTHPPPEMGSPCPPWPCCHQGRAGWVNPPPLPGPSPGCDNLRPRMMPEVSFGWLLYSGRVRGEGGGREPGLRPGFGLEALGPFQGC